MPRWPVALAAGLIVTVVAMTAALGVAELALRAVHFRFRAIPEVQFGWPQPQVIENEFQRDPDLIWVTRDYRERLAMARRAAVIFMGDSCVEFSDYPRLVLARLAARDSSLASGEKISVPGWSSEQGRAQLERDVARLRPRVIAIEFGWNDHWDALGAADDEVHPWRGTAWAADHLRVYQAWRKARLGLESRRVADPPRRVSLDRYRDNLTAMVRAGQRTGARVVLITAPSGHEPGHEPAYLQARHLRRLATLVPLHRSYVEATRQVAAGT
ncbi:MAG: hypothetical protein ABJC51_06470, partial [Acidobacteriota bacterium]